MENEVEKLRLPTQLPSSGQRLACWFGIYLAGAFILPLLLTLRSTHVEPLSLLLEFIEAGLVFPCGFLGVSGFIAGLLHLSAPTHVDGNGAQLAGRVAVLIPVAYATYITHLIYTLKAKTIRVFRYLLVALVVIVALNIGGCYEIGTDSGEATKSTQAAFQQ